MTPETFENELRRRLGSHYRLRWSQQYDRWCIEHKVGRKQDLPGDNDRLIRLRDGYHLVLETEPRPFVVCEGCYFPIPLEPFDKQEVECAYCLSRGERRRYVAAYFPLVDRTLEWLEWCHPRRGAEFDKEMAARNERLARERKNARLNLATDIASDGWQRVVGIPMVGYTKRGTPHQFGSY